MIAAMGTNSIWLRRAHRIGGWGLVLGMLLLAVGVMLHPSEFDPDLRSAPHYAAIHTDIAAGLVVALPGLLLVLGTLWEDATAVDALAALLCTLGWVLFLAQIIIEGLVIPVIQQTLATAPIDVLQGPAVVFYSIGAAAFALGFPLAGWRLPSKGAPVWPTRLLLIAPLPILWPPVPDWLGKTSAVVFAVGLAGTGVWLARGESASPRRSQ